MKKIIIILLLVIVAAHPGCRSKKNISRTTATIDSVQVVKDATAVRTAHVDNSLERLLNVYTSKSNESDLTIDKITRTTESKATSALKFTLNVEKIVANKDTLIAVDELTGTIAKIYKDEKGLNKFDIKPAGSQRETYELSGLRLRSKNTIDSTAAEINKSNYQSKIVDSTAFKIDSVVLNKTDKVIKKDIKRTSPAMYWLGAIVLIIAIISLLAYIFRNKYPAANWVWKKVFRR